MNIPSMKKLSVRFVIAVSVAVLSLAAWAPSAQAQEATAERTAGSYAGEVTASKLHLRAGPGASYQSVLLVERGTKLVVREAPSGSGWAIVEVPGGFPAWVSGKFVQRSSADAKRGAVTVQNLLVRPRASTRFHQLSGRLNKGEMVDILGEKREGDEHWVRIRAPQRIPLYCAAEYLKNIGPASLAVVPTKKEGAPAKVSTVSKTSADARYLVVEKRVLRDLQGARSLEAMQPIRRTLATVDHKKLSLENRSRHLGLERQVFEREREILIASVQEDEKRLVAELDAKIREIESRYQAELAKLEAERRAREKKKNAYTAVGIIEHKPDILGRTPAFQLTKGGKLVYFLIAPAFDLHKFSGKRVGVIGYTNRESGTAHFTIMVKRIEIIGEK